MYTALILAAGKGERTTLSTNKTSLLMDGKPLYKHSVDAFLEAGFKVVLVINENDEKLIKKWTPNITYVYGGKHRGESVQIGLGLVKTKYVFIHDGARPFISLKMLSDIQELLNNYDAVLTCKNATNTIYSKELNLLDRSKLIEAETPQVFLTSKIKEAYGKIKDFNFTDDISVYKECFSDIIGLYLHEKNNDKITAKKDVEKYIMPSMKIGHSFDIHQTSKARKLILGAVAIESEFGLVGHSDADVVLHVVAECLFGAMGIGDLGTHFPDTDSKYQDLDSRKLVLFAKDELNKNGYKLENMDITVFLEKPKLSPYIEAIRNNIKELLNVNYEQINVKASTYEKLDAIGKGEAIAAEAVCLIKKII